MAQIEKLPELCVNLELVSVYDTGCKSIPEQIYFILQKLQDVATTINHNNDVVNEAIAQANEIVNKLGKSGPTQSRPSIVGGMRGVMYFDTGLNKPIWVNSNENGWVDAAGKAV